MSIRSRVNAFLRPPDLHHGAARVFNLSMGGLILANVAATVIESLPAVHGNAEWSQAFHAFDGVSVAIFTVEYLLRLWTCTEEEHYRHPLWGRMKWMISPMAIIDVLAIAPFYVGLAVHHETIDLRFVRMLRLVRILRVLKLTRHSDALQTLWRVIHSKRHDLVNSLILLLMLVVLFASLAYVFEHGADPKNSDHFSSIPAAMWWAVVTLTTVGYGDVFPITVGGRIVAACTAACGIAMFALPTAVLGAAFINELSNREAAASSAGEASAAPAGADETSSAAGSTVTANALGSAGAPGAEASAAKGPTICPHCGKDVGRPLGGVERSPT